GHEGGTWGGLAAQREENAHPAPWPGLRQAGLGSAHAAPGGPLPALDLEAQLASVDDLAQLRVRRAGLALGRGGDVLDADLEADRRLALLEMLECENRGVPLDHPDHAGRREHACSDRAAEIGEQTVLNHKLVGSLNPG